MARRLLSLPLVTVEVKQNGEKLYANIRSSLLLFSKGDEFTVENMSITCRYPYPRAKLWLTSFRICSRIRVHVCLPLLLTRHSHSLSLFPTIQIASRRVYNTAYTHDYSNFCYWTSIKRERERVVSSKLFLEETLGWDEHSRLFFSSTIDTCRN